MRQYIQKVKNHSHQIYRLISGCFLLHFICLFYVVYLNIFCAYILKSIPFQYPVAQIVCQHHERLDGSGYPDGLKGIEIPIMARIIAVSDAFDAMVQKRPYKEKIRIAHAKQIIQINAGKLFDKNVVKAFLSIPDNKIDEILKT